MIEIQIVHDCVYSEALAHIMIAAWRSGFRGILEDAVIEQYTEFDGCKTMFSQLLESSAGTMYLASLNGKPVGLLYWLDEGDEARIEAILTVPEVWGQGVAAALMTRALSDAKTAGFSLIRVWPFADNHRARRFYEKQGFVPSGRSRTGDAVEAEYFRQIL